MIGVARIGASLERNLDGIRAPWNAVGQQKINRVRNKLDMAVFFRRDVRNEVVKWAVLNCVLGN
jgi:hypothetical protein